jgi:hypothetical protein
VPLRPSRRSGAGLLARATLRSGLSSRSCPALARSDRPARRCRCSLGLPIWCCRRPAEGSAEVAARVTAARDIQTARYAEHGVRTNAEADGELLDSVAGPDEPGRRLLAQAAEAMRLSARGYHRILRVARTIADLAAAVASGASMSLKR